MRHRVGSFLHHCIAHPLLFWWPRVGNKLHDITAGEA